MNKATTLWTKSTLGFAIIGLLSVGSSSIFSADDEESDAVEEIVVTGSRIKRADNISAPTPMLTLGEEQIELTGSINVYDILNELRFNDDNNVNYRKSPRNNLNGINLN